jgi:hypothetical protein
MIIALVGIFSIYFYIANSKQKQGKRILEGTVRYPKTLASGTNSVNSKDSGSLINIEVKNDIINEEPMALSNRLESDP